MVVDQQRQHHKFMKKVFSTFIIVCALLMTAGAVQAQGALSNAQKNLGTAGTQAFGKGTQQDLPVLVGNIISAFLGILGIILVVVIIRGGFLYMMAGGNEDQVKKAKQWIINGIIGLILIVLAFAISNFVVSQLATATTKKT